MSEKYSLKPGSELRFEVPEENGKVTVELLSGHAEYFGTDLITGEKYEFGYGTIGAIFTNQGCCICISGNFDAYFSELTPMNGYFMVHENIELLRYQAKAMKSRGPVVMIAGGSDVGKSTISKILLNYAVRSGWNPIHVNIDPNQNSSISIPGTIGASLVDVTAPVGRNFSDKNSQVYHYGHVSPIDNSSHFKIIISELAKNTLRALDDGANKASGMIIDTYRNSQNSAFLNLVHAAKEFKVGIVYVVDGERLAYNLQRNLSSSVKVINLVRSMGVVEKTAETRMESKRRKIKEYFYGDQVPLYPHSIIVKWSDLKVYKIGAPALPKCCLPIGMGTVGYETKIVPVKPGPKLLYRMLGVCSGQISDEEMLKTNVAGFVCVTNVDMEKKTVTLLSPNSDILHDATYLMSEIQFSG